ncbi:MAG: sterol desaturase [Bacteroidetes bacterium]|nr:MAG: sterol desaturase [Bacteroidota bacterium]
MERFFFDENNVLLVAALEYAGFLLRYLLIAGGAYLVFYIWQQKRFASIRIQPKFPEKNMIRMEILYSLSTFAIFSCSGLFIFWLEGEGLTQLYFDIKEYGVTWLVVSVSLMMLMHDTWFYWSHRFMHLKSVFPYVHKVHHLSINPTPMASFSFHPVEAVIEAAIFPILVVSLPLHPLAIVIFLFLMTVMNVVGHLGYEILPKGFTKHWFFKWSNTSTHHNMHHRLVKCNYGLYFNFWDRVMGTNHKQYDEHFEEVKSRS